MFPLFAVFTCLCCVSFVNLLLFIHHHFLKGKQGLDFATRIMDTVIEFKTKSVINEI